MVYDEDEYEIRADDTRRMKVFYTAVALVLVVLLTASYFS